MAREWSGMEAAGAIVSAFGLLLLVLGGIGAGLLVTGLGVLMWRVGEMERELTEVKNELETVKSLIGGAADG